MNDRVRSAIPIELATPDLREALTEMEAERSAVLLVHIHLRNGLVLDHFREKRRTDPLTTGRISDEQHLQVAIKQSCESDLLPILLGNREHHRGEVVRCKMGFDSSEIGFVKEIVGSADRAAPDFNKCCVLLRATAGSDAQL